MGGEKEEKGCKGEREEEARRGREEGGRVTSMGEGKGRWRRRGEEGEEVKEEGAHIMNWTHKLDIQANSCVQGRPLVYLQILLIQFL